MAGGVGVEGRGGGVNGPRCARALDLVDGPTATRSVNRTIPQNGSPGPSRGPYTPLPPRFNDSMVFPPHRPISKNCMHRPLKSNLVGLERFSIVNLVIFFERISSVAELVSPPIYMLRCQRSSRSRKRSEFVEDIGYSRN
eukprot:scaffold61607_cov92-Phaeocystis_antarctica.AAC.1